MASILDVSALTLNEEQAETVSRAVFEKLYNDSPMASLHAINTGIEREAQIPIIGTIGLVGEAVTGCKPPAQAVVIPMSEKTWNPKDWGFRATHCQKDLDPLFRMFQASPNRHNYNDVLQTEIGRFIADRLTVAIQENIQRVIDFSDTNATAVGAGSGSETLTSGVDAKYFTLLDGLWKQIIVSDTANSSAYKVTIAKNAEASKALQMALGSTDAYDTFAAMYDKADSRLTSQPGLQLEVTTSLFRNYISWLEATSQSFSLTETVDGISGVSFRGIPVIERKDWSRNITAYFDDGTVYDKPHRALLTVPANKPVGTMDAESLTMLKSWFSDDDDVNYMQSAIRIDVKYLEDYMGVSAY